MKKAQEDSCTTGKSSIGDEKAWNVFMRLDTPEAQYVALVSHVHCVWVYLVMARGTELTV